MCHRGCVTVDVPMRVWVPGLSSMYISTEDVEVVTLSMIQRCGAWPFGCGRGLGGGKSLGMVCYTVK